MLKPLMSSAHGFELNTSMNSSVTFVDCPGTGFGLYMISVITSPVLRLDGPGGSRSGEYCACASPPDIRITAPRHTFVTIERNNTAMNFCIE